MVHREERERETFKRLFGLEAYRNTDDLHSVMFLNISFTNNNAVTDISSFFAFKLLGEVGFLRTLHFTVTIRL